MNPLLIDMQNQEQAQSLERVPLHQGLFSEHALQEVLRNYPGLLAIDEIDPLFSPALCIGRETKTGAGPLDNLYVSPSGFITIVETKLWKNPQARREVVAQIIDYSKQIALWDYSRLEESFCQYASKYAIAAESLYSYVCNNCDEDIDEPQFADSVQRCLKHGRFLLLIVGDGIHENVAAMASYLQASPNLQFNLQLVEIAAYRLQEGHGQLFLVPSVVGRVETVERAVVRIEMSDEAATRVKTTTSVPRDDARATRQTMTRSAFYEQLTNSVGADIAAKTEEFVDKLTAEHEYLQEDFSSKRLVIKMEFPSTGRPAQSILYIGYDGGVHPRAALARFARNHGIPVEIVETYLNRLSNIAPGLATKRKSDGSWFRAKSDTEPLANLVPKFPELEQAIVQLQNDIERLDG